MKILCSVSILYDVEEDLYHVEEITGIDPDVDSEPAWYTTEDFLDAMSIARARGRRLGEHVKRHPDLPPYGKGEGGDKIYWQCDCKAMDYAGCNGGCRV